MDKVKDPQNLDKEIKFSEQQGFFEKSLGLRLLIGVIFLFSLFTILHFREVSIEIPELNSFAPSYIVAQTDIEFFDEEATIILRQEAVRDVGKIYQITEKSINQYRSEFDSFLITSDEWRKQLSDIGYEEMVNGVELIEDKLIASLFTDSKTLQKMNDRNISTVSYFVISQPDNEKPLSLPMIFWNSVSKTALTSKTVEPKVIYYILRYFQGKSWVLKEDIPAQRTLRRQIQAKIPDKYTHLSAGSRIIDQGEKVTFRHVAILQAMKEALHEERNLWHPQTILGSFILALLFCLISAFFLNAHYSHIMNSNRKLFLVVTVILITFILAKITEFFFLTSRSNVTDIFHYPLFIPFPAILLCSLLNPAIATFVSGFLTFIFAITLSFDKEGFVILNLTAAMVAILSARALKQRKEIFVVCFKAWIALIFVLIAFSLYDNFTIERLFTDILSASIFMLLTAVFAVGLFPLLETGFSIITDVTLMEYMDPNHDLLRRLSIEAPGTYQHSVVVGNLAEAAAIAINANGLFCRVATLYHDIGKMTTPQYFTENQHGGMNIHQLLTPQESAQVIIAHVSEGVAIARKAGLPEQFIDVIKEHHGITLTYYFYRQQLEQVGGDKAKVDEKEFRYSGPTPRSKESAIIMISDSLEAASRSLDKINENTVSDLTNRIIKDKMESGQFDRSLLTLEEMAVVRDTLAKTLVVQSHTRIKYPTREVGEETLSDE